MTGIQEPLTPPDADLRDFPFMPLEVSRLRRSKAWFASRREPEIGFYMLNLWAAAWHEVPVASLEDDDEVLADLAMCDSRRWKRVRDKVLRGWARCSDGRLYHSVVAEKALEAWIQKLGQRKASEAGVAKRQGYAFDGVKFDRAITTSAEKLREINPSSDLLGRSVNRLLLIGRPYNANSVKDDLFDQRPPVAPPVEPPMQPSKGTGRVKGQGEGQGTLPNSLDPTEPLLLPIDEQSAGEGDLSHDSKSAEGGPKPAGQERYPPEFETLWAAYPTDRTMSKPAAFEAWRRLSQQDREDAMCGLHAFLAAAKSQSRMTAPKNYFRERKWEGHLPASSPPGQAKNATTFVKADTPLWDVCKRRYRHDKGKDPPIDAKGGWYFPSAWVPELQCEVAA